MTTKLLVLMVWLVVATGWSNAAHVPAGETAESAAGAGGASLQPKAERTADVDVIYRLDFEEHTPGDYAEAQWKRDWNQPTWANRSHGYGRIVENEGNTYLVQSFPAGSFGAGQGYQWHGRFGRGYDELYFSYRVKFGAGFFNAKLHGKLPGLSGGGSNGGGKLPNGRDGWSARFMFHGTAINFYLYQPDNYQLHGDTKPVEGKRYWGLGPTLDPGFKPRAEVWHTVTQRIVMNTPGNADGLVEGFIDGKLCAVQDGIRFRDIPELKIDRIFFAVFFGGSGVPPSKTETISFDDFCVYTYANNVPVARGHARNPPGTTIPLP